MKSSSYKIGSSVYYWPIHPTKIYIKYIQNYIYVYILNLVYVLKRKLSFITTVKSTKSGKSVYYKMISSKGWKTFYIGSGQIVNILAFKEHTVFVTTTEFHCCSVQVATDDA